MADFCGGIVDGGQAYAPGIFAVGSQVAGYRIEEQIGRGGMAVVYRAADLRLNRVVALKILAPELARDAAFRERFIREMRAAAAVNHPNIVPVFDAGEASEALFIAMLYVSGPDARTLIRTQQPLPADRVTDIIGQVASALDAAHSHGLIHRDVKPANMLLSETAGDGGRDHVYLSDFGLSKQSFAPSTSLTLAGQFFGTLDYMAPEQIEGGATDGRADQYALACAAYDMFTGAPPFKREHDAAAIWAQLSQPAPSLLPQRPDLSPATDRVLFRALAKSPDDRYPTCGEFAAALRASCAADPGPGGVSQQAWPAGQPLLPFDATQTWPRPDPAHSGGADMLRPSAPATLSGYPVPARRRQRPRAAVIAGCVALLAIIGIAVFLLHRNSPASTSGTGASAGHQPVPSSSHTPSAAGPAATVQAYFTAINSHNYAQAWALGGKNAGKSYSEFVQGFAGTAHDDLTIVSVTGNVVTIQLAAEQTNGSVQHYQGTYTVTDGSITASHIESAS